MTVTGTLSFLVRILFVFGLIESVAVAHPPRQETVSKESVSVLAAGDLMLGHRLVSVIRRRGVDYPFDSVASVIREADIAVANLEAPFTTGGTAFQKEYNFAVPPSFITGPVRAGFDLFTLANNHILDFGVEGLRSTIHTLDSTGIAYCGAGFDLEESIRPALLTRKGIRFGFLAFSLTFPEAFWASPGRAGTAYVRPEKLETIIRKVRESADVVIVSFHWGGESVTEPRPYQIQYARRAIDAGADLVFGHHPHVLQGLEIYKGRLIAYSLGNFIFGSYSAKVHDGALLRTWFSAEGLRAAEILPISVNNYTVRFQPRLFHSAERLKTIESLNALSKPLNGGKELLRPDGSIRFKTD
ncbi:MAG TPA: CapA family protein [bacterium]|nr:CapA family protein [bacterium]